MARLKTILRRKRRRALKRKTSGRLFLDEFWDAAQLSPLERVEKAHHQLRFYLRTVASLPPRDRRKRLKLAARAYDRFIERNGVRLEVERAEWSGRRTVFMDGLKGMVTISRSERARPIVAMQSPADFSPRRGAVLLP